MRGRWKRSSSATLSPYRPRYSEPSASLAPYGPTDAATHSGRVTRARRYRPDTRVFSDRDGRGLLVLGQGVCGRREIAFEVDPEHRGQGVGRALVTAALGLVPPGEPLFAQVAPANVASVRAIHAAGFDAVAAEVLFPLP